MFWKSNPTPTNLLEVQSSLQIQRRIERYPTVVSSDFGNSLLNSVLPCTLFNVEFAGQTRCCSISRTSLSALKLHKARAQINRRHAQKWISLSISGLQVCPCKLAAAWNHGHPCPFWYVEDTFLLYDAVDASYILKGVARVDTQH